MSDTHRDRPEAGLDPIKAEVDGVFADVLASTSTATDAFFAGYDRDPDPRLLAAWLVPRCWREIDYVFLLNEEIRRYGLTFERRHITLLAKQSFQEAEHYDMVGSAIESLGGTAPTEVPPEAAPWSAFLWECLDRHPLAAIAAWNVSETSAGGSFDQTIAAGERHGYGEVVRIYRQIEKDERFHIGLGRQVLNRYARTDHDRDEVLRAMHGMRDIAWRVFTTESAVQILGR